MRTSLAIAVVFVLGGTASAGVRDPRTWDAVEVPAACRVFLDLPADARSDVFAWDQALSFAACVQDGAIPPRVTSADELEPMLDAMSRRLALSILIDLEALRNAPARIQLRAAYQVALAYVSLVTRARMATPPELRDELESLLVRPLTTAWLACMVIDRAVAHEPQLAADDVGRHIASSAHAIAAQLDPERR